MGEGSPGWRGDLPGVALLFSQGWGLLHPPPILGGFHGCGQATDVHRRTRRPGRRTGSCPRTSSSARRYSAGPSITAMSSASTCSPALANDDPDGGSHPAPQVLDPPLQREIEVSEQLPRQLGAPVRAEPRGNPDRMAHAKIRIGMFLAHEHHAAQHRVILRGNLPEHPDDPGGRQLLPDDDAHQRGLARHCGPAARSRCPARR